MKSTDKKLVIEQAGFKVKDFATKINVVITSENGKKYFSSIHSAYKSLIK